MSISRSNFYGNPQDGGYWPSIKFSETLKHAEKIQTKSCVSKKFKIAEKIINKLKHISDSNSEYCALRSPLCQHATGSWHMNAVQSIPKYFAYSFLAKVAILVAKWALNTPKCNINSQTSWSLFKGVYASIQGVSAGFDIRSFQFIIAGIKSLLSRSNLSSSLLFALIISLYHLLNCTFKSMKGAESRNRFGIPSNLIWNVVIVLYLTLAPVNHNKFIMLLFLVTQLRNQVKEYWSKNQEKKLNKDDTSLTTVQSQASPQDC